MALVVWHCAAGILNRPVSSAGVRPIGVEIGSRSDEYFKVLSVSRYILLAHCVGLYFMPWKNNTRSMSDTLRIMEQRSISPSSRSSSTLASLRFRFSGGIGPSDKGQRRENQQRPGRSVHGEPLQPARREPGEEAKGIQG